MLSALELIEPPKEDAPLIAQTETTVEATSAEPLQQRLTELEWAQNIYEEVIAFNKENPSFIEVQERESCTKSIVEDIVLTKEKVAELDETAQKLNNLKKVVEEIKELNKEIDEKLLTKEIEIQVKESLFQGKLEEIKQLHHDLTEAKT